MGRRMSELLRATLPDQRREGRLRPGLSQLRPSILNPPLVPPGPGGLIPEQPHGQVGAEARGPPRGYDGACSMRSLGLLACVFAALMCCTCGCGRPPLAHEAPQHRAFVAPTIPSGPRILATSLSPSGRFLALLVHSGQKGESGREESVWLVDLRGSSVPRLAQRGNSVLLHSLSWSDSPEILAWVSWDVASDASQVWLLRPDLGQEPRLALTEGGCRITSATRSVGGRWLAVPRLHRPSPGDVASEISLVRAQDGRALASWITRNSPTSI